MKINVENFAEAWDPYAALEISYWTELSDSVLTTSIREMYEHPFSVIARDFLERPLGYVAVKELNEDGKTGHVGTFVVSPKSKGKGVGSKCLDYLFENFQAVLPGMTEAFAYANHESLPLFIAKGGVVKGVRQPPYKTNSLIEVDLTAALKPMPVSSVILNGNE